MKVFFRFAEFFLEATHHLVFFAVGEQKIIELQFPLTSVVFMVLNLHQG